MTEFLNPDDLDPSSCQHSVSDDAQKGMGLPAEDRTDFAIDALLQGLSNARVPSHDVDALLKSIEFWQSYAAPLEHSKAVQRLKGATFLGILSPKYSGLSEWNFKLPSSSRSAHGDGTRLGHSINVGILSLALAKKLRASEKAQRYITAWGLLHDVATWSLSHTAEPAFTLITGTKASSLREMIIRGSAKLPSEFCISRQLRELGVDPDTLVSIFAKTLQGPADLRLVQELVHSPITPDTLEGMWRTGQALNIPVPFPVQVLSAIDQDLLGLYIRHELSSAMYSFWRRKSEIYSQFINRRSVVLEESRWSESLKVHFAGMTLGDTLMLDEDTILSRLVGRLVSTPRGLFRYKPPRKYYVNTVRARKLSAHKQLSDLRSFLVSEKDEQSPPG